MLRFRAVVEGTETPSTAFVRVPQRIIGAFEGRTRVPVRVTINGVTWRTTIANMGVGPCIGINAAIRKAAGIARGNRIALELERDTQKRTVDVPADFAKAMRAAQRRAFDAMSYSHQKEWVMWIDDAKKPETRRRRIEKALEKLGV